MVLAISVSMSIVSSKYSLMVRNGQSATLVIVVFDESTRDGCLYELTEQDILFAFVASSLAVFPSHDPKSMRNDCCPSSPIDNAAGDPEVQSSN